MKAKLPETQKGRVEMDMLKMVDKKADEVLEKVGIKNKDVQNIMELGTLTVLGYLAYKIWKKEGKKNEK